MKLGKVGVVLGAVVIAGYGLVSVQQVAEAGSCFIGWNTSTTITCKVAEPAGDFEFARIFDC